MLTLQQKLDVIKDLKVWSGGYLPFEITLDQLKSYSNVACALVGPHTGLKTDDVQQFLLGDAQRGRDQNYALQFVGMDGDLAVYVGKDLSL